MRTMVDEPSQVPQARGPAVLRPEATLLVAGALLLGAIWVDAAHRRGKTGAGYASPAFVHLTVDRALEAPVDSPTLRAACFIAFAVAIVAASVSHRRRDEVCRSRIGGLYGP